MTLLSATPQIVRTVTEYLTFPNPAAHYSGGPSSFTKYNNLSETFPTGFFEMVRTQLALAGHDFTVEDWRKYPDEDADADLGWLRDYQQAAVDRVLQRKRGILWMPTGAGKTEVAAALAMRIKGPWLFIAHRAGLMDQAADRFELRSGEKAWRVGGGHHRDVNPAAKFNSVTFDTLRNLVKVTTAAIHTYERFSGVIVDECHVLPAVSFLTTLNRAAAYTAYRVGLSGTPLQRSDGRTINAIGALGPVIYRVKPDLLIDAGVLSRPTIHMLQFAATPSRSSTWAKVYEDVVVKDKLRNDLVVRAIKAAPGPKLCFVKNIAHGKLLKKLCEKQGLRAEFVWGNLPLDTRKRHVRDLVNGRTDILVCSVVFQEGIDIPELESVIMASAGKSAIAALQKIGRGMRATATKKTFHVYDIADQGCGCDQTAADMGTPGVGLHSACKWLEKHTKERIKAYKSEGHEITEEMDW